MFIYFNCLLSKPHNILARKVPKMFNNFQKRSHESPMDWEWQTQGPTDPKSPFPQFKGAQGQKRTSFYQHQKLPTNILF